MEERDRIRTRKVFALAHSPSSLPRSAQLYGSVSGREVAAEGGCRESKVVGWEENGSCASEAPKSRRRNSRTHQAAITRFTAFPRKWSEREGDYLGNFCERVRARARYIDDERVLILADCTLQPFAVFRSD